MPAFQILLRRYLLMWTSTCRPPTVKVRRTIRAEGVSFTTSAPSALSKSAGRARTSRQLAAENSIWAAFEPAIRRLEASTTRARQPPASRRRAK